MNIPFLCVGLAFLMLYLTKIPLGIAMSREGAGYDNHNPREQQARLQGFGKRALGAHQNCFEAFAPFAAAVLIANMAGADAVWSARLAVLFIAVRVLYVLFYYLDWATLRSSVWVVGTLAIGGLMGLGILR